MRIIESGKTCKRVCRFTCKNCDCIFEAEGNEMITSSYKIKEEPGVRVIYDEPYVETACPWCGETVEAPARMVELIKFREKI